MAILFLDSLKKKLSTYVKIAITLTVFIIAYYQVAAPAVQLTLLYFLILVSLFFSYHTPEASIFINSVGLTLLFTSVYAQDFLITFGLTVFLVATIIIPFYFGWYRKWEQENFRKMQKPKAEKIESLQKNVTKTEEKLQVLDTKIEQINRLYLLGRELVEHMDVHEVVENMHRVLLNRPGVKSVIIVSWNKNTADPLYFSDEKKKEKWLSYINQHRTLFLSKKFRTLPTPSWIDDEAVILWPVRLEKELLATLILTVDPDMSDHYLEEGEIFIPQIALGLRRTRLFAEVQERSRIDGLTGLYLRRYFLERFHLEIQRAKRYNSVFSVLMADIDFFKKINDTYGHLIGDEVLMHIAKILLDCTPPGALLGRYGGEEFIILLPLMATRAALQIAHDINKTVHHKGFRSDDLSFNVSISIGISHYPIDGTGVRELLSCADHALYWVKSHGRNNVKEFLERLDYE